MLDISKCKQKSIIFWDVILCNSGEVCQCFRGISVNSNQTILHYNPEVAAVRTSNPTEITTDTFHVSKYDDEGEVQHTTKTYGGMEV
jgi:hypothetical protein